MRTGQRRREILRLVFENGYVEAKQLSSALGVDSSTIRRDLDALAREKQLQRTHGGAQALAGAVDVPYAVKQKAHTPEKEAIAAEAAKFVGDGDSVLLDSGSTTYHLAKALRTRQDLTIVTNDLLIGALVSDYPGVRLLVTGGELLSTTYTLVGERARSFVADLRVDWTFLGADAIDPKLGITNTNTTEIPLKRAMLGVARVTVVVADASKFGQRALVRVADIDEVDHIVCDQTLPAERAAEYGRRLRLSPLDPPPGLAVAST